MAIRRVRRWTFLATITLIFVASASAQAPTLPPPPFTFVGNAISTGARMSGATRLQMTITRWSTDAEAAQLQGSIVELGQPGALRVLEGFEQVGFVRTGTGMGDPIQYARATVVEDGWTVLLATNRPMGVFESYYATRSMEYPFTLIELHLDPQGRGTGAAAVGVQLSWDPSTGQLLIERWDTQLIQLGDVKTR